MRWLLTVGISVPVTFITERYSSLGRLLGALASRRGHCSLVLLAALQGVCTDENYSVMGPTAALRI
jgi:hypothetical protein